MEQFGDDTCDLIKVIERHFGMEFTDEELVASETVGLLSECVTAKQKAAHSENRDVAPADMFPNLRLLIAVEIGVKAERITPNTSFPRGLKIY